MKRVLDLQQQLARLEEERAEIHHQGISLLNCLANLSHKNFDDNGAGGQTSTSDQPDSVVGTSGFATMPQYCPRAMWQRLKAAIALNHELMRINRDIHRLRRLAVSDQSSGASRQWPVVSDQ